MHQKIKKNNVFFKLFSDKMPVMSITQFQNFGSEQDEILERSDFWISDASTFPQTAFTRVERDPLIEEEHTHKNTVYILHNKHNCVNIIF